MKKLIVVALIIVLAVPILGMGTNTRAAAPGCPADFFPMMSKELASACKGELAGKSVTIIGTQADVDATNFQNSFKEFEDWTGITVTYSGSKQFEADVTATVKGGNPPDMADFPQPGLLKSLAKLGYVVDISTFMNMDWLKKNFNQSWLDMANIAGKSGTIVGGVWARNSVKSLVWYPKKAWDAAGYKVPTTWDEMIALSDQIVKDGATPWCIGIESGAATGWAATDWIEDIVLRTAPPETYDNWATPTDLSKRVKFTDPVIKAAVQKMSDIWFNDKYVNGGRKAIVGTNFGDAPKAMFDNPPKCYLHRQATFITSFFPKDPTTGKDRVAGVDYDFFYLPPIDPKYGKPFLVAGDIMSMFTDRPEVRATMDWLSRGESVKTWLATGSTLAPQNDIKPEWYGNAVQTKAAQLMAQATTFRFDGSDQMPAAVGTGTFWKGMADYVSGTTDLDTTLKEIDAGWPTS